MARRRRPSVQAQSSSLDVVLLEAQGLADSGHPRAAGEKIDASLRATLRYRQRAKVRQMGDFALDLATRVGVTPLDGAYLADVAACAYLRAFSEIDHVRAMGTQGDLYVAAGDMSAAADRYFHAARFAHDRKFLVDAIQFFVRCAEVFKLQGDFDIARRTAWHAMNIGEDSQPEVELGHASAARIALDVCTAYEEWENVRQLARFARRIWKAHNRPVDAADCDRVEAEATYRLDDPRTANRLILRARQAYADADRQVQVAYCDYQRARMMIEVASQQDPTVPAPPPQLAWELFTSARDVYIDASLTHEAARCDVGLGHIERLRGNFVAAERLTRTGIDALLANRHILDAARAQIALGDALIAQHKYNEAISAYEGARATFVARRFYPSMAYCDGQLASARSQIGDHDGALEAGLAALSNYENQRYDRRNPSSRNEWVRNYLPTLGLALELADRRSDYRLMAELIESARGQTIPLELIPSLTVELRPGEETDWHGEETDWDRAERPADLPESAGAHYIRNVPLAEPVAITVHTFSALGHADPTGQPNEKTASLEEAAQEVGGADARWWGTVQAGDALYWSLVGPDGSIAAGRIAFDDTSPLVRLLEDLYQALPIPIGGEDDTDYTRRVARGALANPDTEETIATALGQALIPEPLLRVLREADGDRPITLVAAPGPPLERVPLCALGIGDGRRLAEVAVLRYSPSAAFVDRIADDTRRGLRGRGGPGPIVAAVLDPDRNRPLPYAADLASALSDTDPLIAECATKSALKRALESAHTRPGSPGVFLYSGHARTPDVPGIALLCLHHEGEEQECPIQNCCGGTPLTSSELFAQQYAKLGAGNDCSYQMPGRILLSACDTAGTAARHSGEWLALAPAMMWAGARLVIAASWPTIDDPRTLEMDLALIETLMNHDDPAEALRRLQVEKLQRWRQGMDDKDPLSPICGWSPLFWAPYVAVGFREG